MSDLTFFIDRNVVLAKEIFSGLGNIYIFNGRELSRNELAKHKNIVLISRSQTKINHELLDGCNVLFYGTATSGTDHVDIEYLKQQQIPFAEAKGSNANSVAEYVLYSILKYSINYEIDVKESKIGIIGYGSIGKIVADYSHRLGLTVLVNDPILLDEGYNFKSYLQYATLEQIFSECNIVTNHVPLTQTGKYPTKNLIHSGHINLLGSDALIIHASRGGILDEKSLKKHLQKNDITLSIDVWQNEPDFDPELAEMALISSPHIAGYSFDGKLKGTLMMAEAVEKTINIKTRKELIYKELEHSSRVKIEDISPAKLIRLLDKIRRFEQDTAIFKQISRKTQPIRINEFDAMRKNYPIRREVVY